MKSDELTYTSAITELEAIVTDIESGEVDVDALAQKVKRATELIKFCNDRLKGTQDVRSTKFCWMLRQLIRMRIPIEVFYKWRRVV